MAPIRFIANYFTYLKSSPGVLFLKWPILLQPVGTSFQVFQSVSRVQSNILIRKIMWTQPPLHKKLKGLFWPFHKTSFCVAHTECPETMSVLQDLIPKVIAGHSPVVQRWATDRWFGSQQGLGIFPFTTASRQALGSTQPPIQWVPGSLSVGVKRPGRESDQSPPSSARSRMRGAIPPLTQYASKMWCSVKKSTEATLHLHKQYRCFSTQVVNSTVDKCK